MDIIIPYIPSRVDTLKYALRSIEKYLTGYGKIFIVGKKVDWLKNFDNCINGSLTVDKNILPALESEKVYGIYFIECEEDKRKQYCIFKKILAACNDERVSDKFIMWNDDHFLLKPLDEIKYWKSGNLDTLQLIVGGTYQGVVRNANKYLKECGYSNHHFDIHVPIVFDKYKFILLQEENWEQEHLIKSLYCNRWGIKGEDMKDLKFGKPFKREEIRKAIEGRTFFSISEPGTNESMMDILQGLYPEKSKWEV